MVTQDLLEQLLVELAQAGVELWVEEGRLRSRSPEGAITPILREQIRLRRDEMITLLQQRSANPSQRRIKPTLRTQQLPLSFAQQRLWFLAELGSAAAYNMPLALEIEGQLEITALQQTLREIVRRHESLRTTFVLQEGVPYQMIHPPCSFDLPVVDLRGMESDSQTSEVKRLRAAEALRPFDLTHDLLLRAHVLQLGEERFTLLLTLHHIAADGWSMGVLVRELSVLYAGYAQAKPSTLPALPIQYADFAVWQREYLQGEVLERQLTWWKAQVADAPALLQLPTDHPRPGQQSFRGEAVAIEIEAGLTQQLRQLSQQQGCTLYMTLLAAFQVLLHRYTGQAQIVVGSPIANRNHQELEGLIGFFVNMMALRANLSGNPRFLDVLAQVQSTTQAAYDHQDLPFERLVEELSPERDLTYNPLVQVVFALQNAPVGDFTLPGLRVKPAAFEVKTTRLDIELHVWEVDDQLKGYCIYASDLFERATIARMLGHYQELLKGIVAEPIQSIGSLPLLTPPERQQLLVEWNDTTTDYPKGKTIHQLFEEQVERTPGAVAVVMAEDKETSACPALGAGRQGAPARAGEASQKRSTAAHEQPTANSQQQLTYAELNTRANQLAHYLQTLGVGPDVSVGIYMERSLELMVGLLGILKAGGAYVPLDPTYPKERLAFMLEDSQAALLLTQTALLDALPLQQANVICLDRLLLPEGCTDNPTNQASEEALLYVMYTSGSTGRPKGVQLAHRALVNLTCWQQQHAALGSAARTAQFTPISFDVSCQELFTTWCTGGTVVLLNEETRRDAFALLHFLSRQQIERLFLPFVALQQLAEVALTATVPLVLRDIITAGEQLQITPALAHFCRQADCTLHNHYGPTESHVVTAFTLTGDATHWPSLPPIGRPLANTQIYLFDANQQPTPIGIPGELYIGGAGVARGYLNRPALTAEKFVYWPVGDGQSQTANEKSRLRLYKTGDLARWRPDGNIEYLGRIDQQVKLRGFRIELGEIEAVLRQHPDIQETIVSVREDTPGAKQLVAYVVQPATGNGSAELVRPLQPAALRAYLQAKLPDYMLPSAFVWLNALPLTPNGKVDRKALPAPDQAALSAKATAVPPDTPTERALAAIWSEVLGIKSISRHDNFFERGGHSLLATQVLSRLREIFTITLPLRTIFQSPTLVALAEAIDFEQFKQVDSAALLAMLTEVEGLSAQAVMEA